ncbi:MAG: pilus assembly protein PilM, partial [Candidatus Margulisiibacteriota bacterium]
MEFFAGKKPNLVGIDTSGGYVRLSELKVDEKGTAVLENYVVAEIPAVKETEDKKSAAIKTLKEAFSKLSSDKKDVFAMIAGSDVSIRRVFLPKLSGKDLAEAIKWETKTHFPFPVDKVMIDHHVIGKAEEKGSEKLDTWIVAAQKDFIAQNNMIFEKAGINLNGISVPPFAAWNLLKIENQLKENTITVFISIGFEITGISFFNGQKLEFYRDISIAGNNITNAMVGQFVTDNWQMNINYEQAEKLKRQYGIPAEGTEEKSADGVLLSNILQIIKPVLRRFLNDVLRSFDYYKEQYHRDKIDRVIISG